MRTKALILTGACLFIGGSAQAEYHLGNWNLSGSAYLEGQMVSGNNEQHALFNKYTDISDGVTGDLNLNGEKDNYSLGFKAFDMGRKDQAYRLDGGMAGGLSWELFYNEIINHKATVGVKGPWDGIGTTSLTPVAGVNFANPNPGGDGYNPFEFSIHRKQFGVSMDILKDSPFFAKIGYNRENQSGLRAWGVNPALSTSENVYEIPELIDYKTDNVNASVGYRNDDNMVALDVLFSSFGDNNKTMKWAPTNPTQNPSSLQDTAMLAQDNKYWNFSLRDTVYNLPMDSTFTAKAGYSRISSTFDVLNSSNSDILYSSGNGTSSARTTLAKIGTVATDNPSFDGLIEYKSADLALASTPLPNLETRLFYGYLNKKNKSSDVTYSGFPTITTFGTNSADYNGSSGHFGYFKHHAGAEAQYKLIANTKLGVAYDFLQIHREERDFNPKDTDHKVTLSVKNSSLEWLTAKARVSYLARLADYGDAAGGTDYFDAAAKRVSTVGLDLDANPIEPLDLGFTAEYSYARYLDTTLAGSSYPGRYLDRNWTFAANAGYMFAPATHVGVYGELERYVSDTEIHNPATYNERYYTLGTDFSMPVIRDVMDFTAGYSYHRGNAKAEGNEFTTGFPSASTPVPYLDDYTSHSLKAQVSYKVMKNLSAKVGYMYAKLFHADTRNEIENGAYSYNSTTQAMTLSGATNDWDYNAHVGYVGAEYTF